MKMVEVLVIRNNGDIKFQFTDPKLQKKNVVVDNIATLEVENGQKWLGTIIDSTSTKKQPKSPLVVRLQRKIDVPKLNILTELEGFWIDPKKLRHIQILLLNNKDVMLVGHKGVGKTDLAHRLSNSWECAMCKVDCGTLQTSSALFGFEAAEKGATIWRPSNFWLFCQEAIRQPAEIFLLLLDEINRMHSKMAESLHGLYDHTRQVSFTTSEGTKVLKLPKNIMTICTRNIGHQYTGTYSMDAALTDRFTPFQLDYLPADFEIKILCDKHGIHQYQAEKIVKIANSMRLAESKGLLSSSPSPRQTDVAAILVKHGETVTDAVESVFLGAFEKKIGEDEQTEENEYSLAASHLRKHLKEAKVVINNGK